MVIFSLVIPTMGRTAELEVLFESLVQQHFPQLECIVVDQNPDERLLPIIARWSNRLEIRHVRSSKGASKARNTGLAMASGQFVAFPDDDCWYSPSLLHHVYAWFKAHANYDILTVGACDEYGVPSGNRWIQRHCEIRAINAFRTTFCSSIFLRLTEPVRHASFDECAGPGAGTPWFCGEETDYILQLMHHGSRGHFEGSLTVGHPKRDMLSGEVDSRRARGYGAGMGYTLQKHSLFALGAALTTYDVLRAVLVSCMGNIGAAKLCLEHARGIVTGLLPRTQNASIRHGLCV